MHTVKGHPILALTFSESQPCFAYILGDLLILLSLSFTLLTEPLLPLVIRKQMSVFGDKPLGVTEVSSIAADLSRSTDGARDNSHATWDPTAEFTCSDINHTSPLRISALGSGWHVSFTWLVTITLYCRRPFLLAMLSFCFWQRSLYEQPLHSTWDLVDVRASKQEF